MAEYMGFEEVLEEDDYGIIVGKDGSLKGIWIPSSIDDEDYIPDPVVQLIKISLGIDISDPDSYPTIH